MNTLSIYRSLRRFPFGRKLFTFLVCMRLPYFFSIKPKVQELTVGRSVVEIKDRWRVRNHLNTVHAIALCNLCEIAMAMVTEATIPKNLRYIPFGMSVEYKKKARGTLRAVSEIQPEEYRPGRVDVKVDVYDREETNVMSAVITLDVKERP